MLKRFRYWRWKRSAKKAVAEGLSTECHMCDDPIVPGDFVGIGVTKDQKEVLVHAGYHFSLSHIDAFCETGAIGCAVWDGKQALPLGESLAARAMRTGQPQVM